MFRLTKDLPAWQEDNLPDPLPFSSRNLIRVVGPGAILLAGCIGGGEWLVGPAIGVQFGLELFWIATIAIAVQVVFNLEAMRYTLCTGEPIVIGIMRLAPNSRFWGSAYVLATGLQLGLPAMAGSCAAVLFSAFVGRVPEQGDGASVTWISYGVILAPAAILLFGKTVERILELFSWVMIAFIFSFLVIVNLVFVPFAHWMATLVGFLSFGQTVEGVNLPLVGALAATAGAGGIANLAVSSWARDKGFGMGAKTGAIAGAVRHRRIALSAAGRIFPVTAANLERFRGWQRYVRADQVWLWGLGAFVGMFLNVNLATGIMPPGTDISQIGAGAYQAEYMARNLWTGFWALALLNGFWLLFSTHIANTDVLIRTITDILWVGSPGIRRWRGGDVSYVYYALLGGFTVWALIVVNLGSAMSLMTIMGNLAGLVLAVASVQLLMVNTKLLPREVRPSLWRRATLIACSLFYTCFFVIVVWDRFG